MIGDPLLGPTDDDGEEAVAAAPPRADDEPTDVVEAVADEHRPADADGAAEPPPSTAPDGDGGGVPDDPAPTRVVPAPVLPPGGLTPGASAPGRDDHDPLWAATTAAPTAADPSLTFESGAPADITPPIALSGLAGEPTSLGRLSGSASPAPPRPAAPGADVSLGATTAMPGVRADDLTATTAMPGVRADDLTATTAMPGLGRSIGPNDTRVMPSVQAPAPGAEHAPGFEKAQRRHRRRWWRRSFKALLLLVVLGFVYVGVNLALVIRTANTDQARAVDVIVVLGAAQYDGTPSPQLRARLDHTIDLWEEGLADVVFVTGGNQPGDRFTEAESSRNYLVEHGVPEGVIQMEDTAHSTWESLSNFAEVAEDEGWERVLLVTDPYHSLRSRLIAQQLGLTAYTSPTQTSPVQGGEELMKEVKEALGISVGRIIGFDRLFDITG